MTRHCFHGNVEALKSAVAAIPTFTGRTEVSDTSVRRIPDRTSVSDTSVHLHQPDMMPPGDRLAELAQIYSQLKRIFEPGAGHCGARRAGNGGGARRAGCGEVRQIRGELTDCRVNFKGVTFDIRPEMKLGREGGLSLTMRFPVGALRLDLVGEDLARLAADLNPIVRDPMNFFLQKGVGLTRIARLCYTIDNLTDKKESSWRKF